MWAPWDRVRGEVAMGILIATPTRISRTPPHPLLWGRSNLEADMPRLRAKTPHLLLTFSNFPFFPLIARSPRDVPF